MRQNKISLVYSKNIPYLIFKYKYNMEHKFSKMSSKELHEHFKNINMIDLYSTHEWNLAILEALTRLTNPHGPIIYHNFEDKNEI